MKGADFVPIDHIFHGIRFEGHDPHSANETVKFLAAGGFDAYYEPNNQWGGGVVGEGVLVVHSEDTHRGPSASFVRPGDYVGWYRNGQLDHFSSPEVDDNFYELKDA